MLRYKLIGCFLVFSGVAFGQCTYEKLHQYYYDNASKSKTILVSDGGYLTALGAAYDTLNPGTNKGQDVDMCLIKTDSCGNTLWKIHYGYPSEGDDVNDVVETSNGDFLVTGYAAFQLGRGNIRVARFGKNGNLIWAKLYTGSIRTSNSNTIFKRKNKNNYVIGGVLEDASKKYNQGYFLEIDDNGNVVKEAVLGWFNPLVYPDYEVQRIFENSDTTYLSIVITYSSGYDSLFLVETDTSFNIKSIMRPLYNDFSSLNRFYDACLSFDHKSITIGMACPFKSKPFTYYPKIIANISFDGHLNKYKALPDSIPYPMCITPTSDNGYLTGPNILKVDSNLDILSYHSWQTNVYGFESIVVNKDKSITASGSSKIINGSYYELIIIKEDSNGNYIHLGITEPEKIISNFNIYPNPATSILNIQTNINKKLTAQLFDLTGKAVTENVSFVNNTTINLQELPQGLYFVYIKDAASSLIKTQKVSVIK